MMPNILVILGAALIPMVIGAIWYNPAVFGNAWMKASGMTEEKVKSGNMVVILIVSFILAFMLAFVESAMVIHQSAIGSLYMGVEGFQEQMMAMEGPVYDEYMALMEKFAGSFRTFKHGALHGFIAGLFFAVPVLGINGLFERKGFKYILVNGGYWIVTLMLMGGVICQWA